MAAFEQSGHTLVLGGARSGKSLFAERLALSLSKTPAYIATAGRGDEEMARRIKKHQERRGKSFVTFQEPLKLAQTIKMACTDHKIILVDCLTIWLSNLMFSRDGDMEENINQLLDVLKTMRDTRVIMVSSEVGMGIVPEHEISRLFRDRIGELHQQLAIICSGVYFVAAGLPLALKGKLAQLD